MRGVQIILTSCADSKMYIYERLIKSILSHLSLIFKWVYRIPAFQFFLTKIIVPTPFYPLFINNKQLIFLSETQDPQAGSGFLKKSVKDVEISFFLCYPFPGPCRDRDA